MNSEFRKSKVLHFIIYLRDNANFERCNLVFLAKFYIMSKLIEEIFFIFVIIYVLKFLARLFLPVLAKKVVEKASEQFQQQQNQYQNTTQQAQNHKSDKPHETKKVGEYIDYEEVD